MNIRIRQQHYYRMCDGYSQTNLVNIPQRVPLLIADVSAAPSYELTEDGFLLLPLVKEIRPFSWNALENRKLKPIDELSETAIQALGDYGYRRFQEFRDAYGEGWDFGRGKPLSHYAIALLDFFLAQFSNFATEPSLFLTTDGHLQLIWEDRDSHEIIIEFSYKGFMYYLEKSDEEGEVSIETVDVLIRKIVP